MALGFSWAGHAKRRRTKRLRKQHYSPPYYSSPASGPPQDPNRAAQSAAEDAELDTAVDEEKLAAAETTGPAGSCGQHVPNRRSEGRLSIFK